MNSKPATGIVLDLTPNDARMVAPVLRIGIRGAAAHSDEVIRFWQGVLRELEEFGGTSKYAPAAREDGGEDAG